MMAHPSSMKSMAEKGNANGIVLPTHWEVKCGALLLVNCNLLLVICLAISKILLDGDTKATKVTIPISLLFTINSALFSVYCLCVLKLIQLDKKCTASVKTLILKGTCVFLIFAAGTAYPACLYPSKLPRTYFFFGGIAFAVHVMAALKLATVVISEAGSVDPIPTQAV